jgi:hypothetical protein
MRWLINNNQWFLLACNAELLAGAARQKNHRGEEQQTTHGDG